MTDKSRDVVKQVRDLIALAVGSRAVEEARTAALQACRLMALHQLEITRAATRGVEEVRRQARAAVEDVKTRAEARGARFPDRDQVAEVAARVTRAAVEAAGDEAEEIIRGAIRDLGRGKRRRS